MKRIWLSLVCALALGATACDNNNNGTDGGARDSGSADSGPVVVELPVLRAASGTELVDPDLSCLGMRSAPTAGDAANIPVRTILRGATSTAQANTTVRVFPGNRILSGEACAAPDCIQVMTDGSGNGSVSLPEDSWFAYQVQGDAAAATSTTAQVNVAASPEVDMPAAPATPLCPGPDGCVQLSVISRALFEGALGAASVSPQVGTSYFTGTARDCAGRPLVGAQIRIFGASGEIVGGTSQSGVRYVYWGDMGLFPSTSQRFTSLQGRYAGGNIPPEATLRMELWGVRSEGAEPTLIGCEEFGGQEDQVTILNIDPLRSDAPASCTR